MEYPMAPNLAVIISPPANPMCNKKICGLYPLERIIVTLSRNGVKEIYLDLSDSELAFYRRKIKPAIIKKLEAAVHETLPEKTPEAYLEIQSNLFVQMHYFTDFNTYFTGTKYSYHAAARNDVFAIETLDDIKKAKKLLRETIIVNTSGFIARTINKRISLPISTALTRTRIHPNYLTVFNMIIGIMSAVFILFDSYWYTVLGGLFFQLASVFDGVDGEVAKYTLKVSKIGGWLDTISDNGTLLMFLSAASYLYFIHNTGVMPLVVIGLLFLGLGVMLLVMVSFLRKYTSSGSLVTYDKEFIQKLPESDPVVFLVQKLKYITKKEFFSIVFFLVSLTGMIYLLIPIIAVVLDISALLLLYLSIKYNDPEKLEQIK